MRTLSEQIQRLRDVLVTCYNAIQRKGGTIPEAGERNMTNLPAAVLSIPQVHSELTELTVTANGEYLPADHDVDGFSKVTAMFDISSLPKVKVSLFRVTNDCINEDGSWVGVGIDTSLMTDFSLTFDRINSLESVDISGLSIENGQNFMRMFYGCENLTSVIMPKITSNATNMWNFITGTQKLHRLDTSGWDTSNVTNMTEMFYGTGIQYIDATSWDVSNCTTGLDSAFRYSCGLISVVGDRTLKQVIDDDIAAFNGAKSCVISQYHRSINTASILAVVNGLADLTGQTEQTIALGIFIGARLDTEQIAGVPAKEYLASKAAEKNWTISF